MASYVVGRLLWTVPVLIFVSLITFVLMHSVEGGPWDRKKKLREGVVKTLNVKSGLDEPLYRQYGTFLLNALKGDIGISFQRQDQPVRDILAQGFKVTAVLGALAVVFAVTVGVSLGVLAATHRNGPADYASLLLASLGSAIPSFALGIFLIYVFAVKLHALPVFGWGSPRQAILPLVTLAAL